MNELVMKVIGNYTYNTKDCLGQGVYGKVFVGYDRDTKQKVAIKKIDITSYSHDHYLENSIFYQIFLLKNLNHPNIVKFKDVLTTKNSLYIVTEYCKHGDLKELLKRKKFREDEAFEVIRQIICGFSQLVKEHIIHRDLKPANILINDGVFKIGDFGFAKYVQNMYNHLLKTCVGSPIYMSPQLLEHTHYTTKADIWSIGVICFEIFFNTPPWKARNEAELLNNIRTISLSSIIKNQPTKISSFASDFLKRLLAYNEKDRISWEQLFAYFKIENPLDSKTNIEPPIIRQNQVISSINIVSNQNRSSSLTQPFRAGFGNQKHFTSQNHYLAPRNHTSHINSYSSPPIAPSTSTSPLLAHHNSQNNPPSHIKPIPLTHKSSFLTIQQLKLLRQQCIYKHFVGVQFKTNYNLIQSIMVETRKFDKMLLLLAGTNKLKSTYAYSILQTKKQTTSQKGTQQFSKLIQKQKQLYESFEKQTTKLLQRKGSLKLLKQQIVPKLTSVEGGQARIKKTQELLLQSLLDVSRTLYVLFKQKIQIYSEGFTLVRLLDYLLDLVNLSLQKGLDYNIVELLIVPTRTDDYDSIVYFNKVTARGQQMGLFSQ